VLRNGLASREYSNGQLVLADTTIRGLLRDDPSFLQGYRTLGVILIEQHKYVEADTMLRRLIDATDRNSFHVALRGMALALDGRPDEAQLLLKELLDRSRKSHVSAGAVAVLSDALGDREEAIRWLRRSVEERDWSIRSFSHSPIFKHLRADPRAEALLASTEQVK
jgi:predicted Zn-dependent protease